MKWRRVAARSVLPAIFTLALGVNMSRGQDSASLNLMPLPAKAQRGDGALKIGANFQIAFAGYREPRLDRASQRFLHTLRRETGIVFLSASKAAATPTLLVATEHESKPVQELGEDESYTLDVTPAGAKLHAANPLGALRGLQTFLQLVAITPDGFAAPSLHIEDHPRFTWRGLMIDSARHFMPLEVIRRNLDGMEAVKMNVFHWHLSDYQGFRLESRKYPKLHEQGSDGLYYTQQEIREVIEYARDRGIRVVPEFDMPGHSTAWFAGYPELASGNGPYSIERKWGVFDPAMDPTEEKTYKFLGELIGEMGKLFPDQYFHIGGDEVNGKEWDANPKIQAFKQSHKIKTNVELQAYFSGRVQELVTKHKKIPVGWDEVLVPGVSKNIVIQSWRGVDALAAAAKDGYRGILSNGYYLDLGWSTARHYAVDPLGGPAASLTPQQKQLVLGGESCIWSEYVNAENIDSRIWPRNAAVAERLWSPEGTTDLASMYARMGAEAMRLEWLGLTHRSFQRTMLQRIAGGDATPDELAALSELATSLEHQKDYTREESAPTEPTSFTALNRLVDAAYPESDVSRRFSNAVDQYLATSCTDAAIGSQIHAQLAGWWGLDARLQALAQRSQLMQEAAAASTALSQSAKIVLNALAAANGAPLSDEQKKAAMDTLNVLEKQAHKSQLTIPELPAFQKLVQASATGGVCNR